MLTLFAKHGLFDLTVKAKGDTEVDYHHTVEDVGLVLGQAFKGGAGRQAWPSPPLADFTCPRWTSRSLASSWISAETCPWFTRSEAPTMFVRDFIPRAGEGIFPRLQQHPRGERARQTHLRRASPHHVAEALFKCLARAARPGHPGSLPPGGRHLPSTKGQNLYVNGFQVQLFKVC